MGEQNLLEHSVVTTETFSDAVTTIAKAAEEITVAFTVVAEAFGKWIRSIADAVEAEQEMETAMRWASRYNRKAYHRYRHTKKKRTRKKYAKRILEWYRTEVVANDLRNI